MGSNYNPLKLFLRQKHYVHPGGITYPGGIKYYPRNEDFKEPEYTPTKLFRVERIKPVKGNPWWQKQILKAFKIDEWDRVTIVKNIPEVNARLWRVKHLIKVTPITFPYGEPTAEDVCHTILKENGECLVTKKLAADPKSIEAHDNYEKNPKKMDIETLKKDSRLKWLNPYQGGY